MQPGIYADIASADYHSGPGVSCSALKLVGRSPSHYWSAYRDPQRPAREQSAALRMGEAIHCAILEPQRFVVAYRVAPQVDRRTKAGKEAWEAFVAECEEVGAEPLSADEHSACEAIAAQANRHPILRAVRDGARYEHSAYWIDPITETLCKARPDWLTSRRIVLDVKSTADASPREFAKSIARYQYAMQAAYYLDGITAAGCEVDSFVFVAVEKTAPFGIACYAADAEMLTQGRAEYRRLLAVYAECDAADQWPGYPQTVAPISLPAWALSQSDE